MIQGECRLCLSVDNLQKSHVLSEFLYKPLYDEKHRASVAKITRDNHGSVTDIGDETIQKGLREELLCNNCELLLCKWEHYTSQVFKCLDEFFSSGTLPINAHFCAVTRTQPDGLVLTECTGIDYKKLKLFLLSIVWRASIATGEAFKETSLGPHEEKMRLKLLSEDPGDMLEYPVLIARYWTQSGLEKHFMSTVERGRIDGSSFYRFLAHGYSFNIFISTHALPVIVKAGAISPSTPILILHMTEYQSQKNIDRIFGLPMASINLNI
jgi:hypothetical protein